MNGEEDDSTKLFPSQEEPFLGRLRKDNQERTMELDRLREEYERECGEASSQSASIQEMLEAELEIVRNQKTDENELVVASLWESTNQPSQDTIQSYWMKQYAENTIETYRDLAETLCVLETELERNTKKLERKRSFLQQQKSLFLSMQERQTLESDPRRETIQNQSIEYDTSNIQKENEWVKKELRYVCQKLSTSDGKPNEEQSTQRVGTKRSSVSSVKNVSRNKRKKKQHRKEEDDSTTLERLVLELTERLLNQPDNPYISVERNGSAEDDSNHTDTASTSQSALLLLKQCGLIQSHPDNEHTIRLIDLRK